MGDLKKVQPGDKLRIPAETFNTFVDVARMHVGDKFQVAQEDRSRMRSSGIILVRNDSGGDRDRWNVLGIDSPIFSPATAQESFENQPMAVSGVVPYPATHEGRFVILLEPIASGALGRAMVSGIVQVKINVSDANHQTAAVGDGVTGNLISSASGSATILWKESGTGVKWALVRFGSRGGGGGNCKWVIVTNDLNKALGNYKVKEWGSTRGAVGSEFDAKGVANALSVNDVVLAAVDADGVWCLTMTPYAVYG